MSIGSIDQKRVQSLFRHDFWFYLLFAFSCVLNLVTTYYVTHFISDSDAAGTLLFAHHLSQKGALLSSEWFYSTEITLLGTHLIYSPLFLLFKDWQTVRFIGTLILQMILLLSFRMLCSAVSFPKRARFLGYSLLILPFSMAYGRLILYHTFYIFCLAISFALIALVFQCNQDFRLHRSTKQKILHLVLIALLALACGISGIRQLGITLLPLLLAIGVMLYQADWSQPPELRRLLVFLPSIATLILATLLGLACNGFLSSVFVFPNYGHSNTAVSVFSQLAMVAAGFFHHFGFRQNAMPYLPYQIMEVIGISAIVVFTVLSFVTLIKRNQRIPLESEALQHLYPCGLLVAAVPFFFLSSISNYVSYFLFYIIWLIPLLLLILYTDRSYSRLLDRLQRISAIAMVMVMLANSLINSAYFINYEHMPFQDYAGLGDWNISSAKTTSRICDQLLSEGYDLGYCTYWQSNIMTDVTDGQLKTVTIDAANEQDGFVYCDWLTPKSHRQILPEKPFILMEPRYREVMEASPLAAHCQLIMETPSILIYAPDDPLLMKNHLDGQGYSIRYDDVGT